MLALDRGYRPRFNHPLAAVLTGAGNVINEHSTDWLYDAGLCENGAVTEDVIGLNLGGAKWSDETVPTSGHPMPDFTMLPPLRRYRSWCRTLFARGEIGLIPKVLISYRH
jgi:hypothetical protein